MRFFKIERKKTFWFLYTLLFIMISVIIFSPFIIKGNSFIRDGDGFNQTYPVLIYIGKYLRELVKSGFSTSNFDFTLGLGEDIITSLTWLGFGDIFTLLAAFFPAEKTAYLFSFIVVLKLYCSGATFAIYSFHRGFHKNAVLLGSLLYAFNRFSLVMGLEFYQTLNPVVWLPLLAMGIDKIISGKQNLKFCPVFILTIFIQSINGFYFLYVNTIFCVVYFLFAYWMGQGEKHSVRDFCRTILAISLNYLLGIMLGAFIFIPALVGYLGSSRTGRSVQSIKELLLYSKSSYMTYIKCLLMPKAWQQSLTLPIIGVIGLIVIAGKEYENKFIKIMNGMFLILFLFPITGTVMNGFSYSIDRWSFMIYFLSGILTADLLSREVKVRTNYIVLFGLVAAVSLGLQIFSGEEKSAIAIRFFVYLILIAISIIFMFRCMKKDRGINLYKGKQVIGVSLWVLANIIINGLFISGPVVLGGDGYSGGFRAYDDVYRQIEDSIANGLQNEDGFYRIDTYDSSLGSSLILDYNGATQYFSILNDNIYEFFKQMSISPGIRSVSHIIKGLDGRAVMETLLSVRYYQEFQEYTSGEYKPYIIKNQYELPLGFTYDKYILKSEFDDLTSLQKMQTIMEAVVVEEPLKGMKTKLGYENKCQLLKNTYTLENIREEENRMTVDENSRINIQISDLPSGGDGELYIQLNNFMLYSGMSSDVQVGNKNIQIRNTEDFYYIGVDDFLVNVSVPKDGIIEIQFEESAEISLESIQVYWYDMSDFSIQVESLSKEHLDNLHIDNRNISGNISLEEAKALFLSIPYSSGWKAKVDGHAVKIERTNIGFMSIPLEAGEHLVELDYTTPGMREGVILTVVGFILFTILLVRSRKTGENA